MKRQESKARNEEKLWQRGKKKHYKKKRNNITAEGKRN
jgi:hypothetical protein